MSTLPMLQRRYAPQLGQQTTATALPLSRRHYVRNAAVVVALVVLVVWTAFPFVWILMTSLKNSADIISAPPKFVFLPTADNYTALFLGAHQGQQASARPDFPSYFLNSVIISTGAVVLSVLASIPAAYALARFTFPLKNALGFIFMSFRFVPFLAFVIPLYLLYQRVGLYNTHTGLILAYQLITLPFTIWMLRSFFMEVPLEIQEAAQIDGCSWFGILTRVILPLSMPGIAVTVILGFMFCWNAFNYPLMLAGRQTFPVTVGAIQFISYEQVLWGQMAAATIVSALPQLLLSLMVQKYIVRGLTMGAVR
jgi:multiple sugar transport system permease protein